MSNGYQLKVKAKVNDIHRVSKKVAHYV